MKFDRVGVFEYSHEEGTRGYELVDDVPPEEKKRRSEEVMAVQQGISLENNETLVGQQLKVIVDRKEGKLWVGRSEYDSPEVDNEIWIEPNGLKIIPGSFVDVRVTGASDYDLNAIALPAS